MGHDRLCFGIDDCVWGLAAVFWGFGGLIGFGGLGCEFWVWGRTTWDCGLMGWVFGLVDCVGALEVGFGLWENCLGACAVRFWDWAWHGTTTNKWLSEGENGTARKQAGRHDT